MPSQDGARVERLTTSSRQYRTPAGGYTRCRRRPAESTRANADRSSLEGPSRARSGSLGVSASWRLGARLSAASHQRAAAAAANHRPVITQTQRAWLRQPASQPASVRFNDWRFLVCASSCPPAPPERPKTTTTSTACLPMFTFELARAVRATLSNRPPANDRGEGSVQFVEPISVGMIWSATRNPAAGAPIERRPPLLGAPLERCCALHIARSACSRLC